MITLKYGKMKKHITVAIALLMSTGLMAQNADTLKKGAAPKPGISAADSLLNAMGSDTKDERVAIFKSSRFILTQTTETVKKHNLNFLVIHRFGDFAGKNGGGKLYYGLDDIADVYLGFEYGVTDNLNIDIGRSTIGGLADLEIKYALLHQTTQSSPLAITVIGESGARPYGTYTTFGDRVSYFGQLILARKFSPGFALQLAPSIVQDNQPMPNAPGNTESFVSLNATARFRLTKHLGLIVDYAHPFSSYRSTANGFHDPLGFGLEMETGGHVFTINVTNTRAVSEINYLSDTESTYSKGQYRVGFTISRMFDFNRRKAQ